MYNEGKLYLGLAEGGSTPERVYLPLSHANRHGLIAGASGTGKTITMKVMAESFSAAGVPVFLCDVKGDVSGIHSGIARIRRCFTISMAKKDIRCARLSLISVLPFLRGFSD